ncbi:MAG: prepilin-type N-terminal cleavage/methylation domain-containing protein [Methylococcales bacterium]|mgnify:CR=1|jgi:prepilin-type N-terminal cleavage/methylation domain-containing protein|nr:prepilin-type N-terminal cleavage/methylation domain-containing protein [Methylococcales bacterium]
MKQRVNGFTLFEVLTVLFIFVSAVALVISFSGKADSKVKSLRSSYDCAALPSADEINKCLNN